jgi:hypothetical protein
MSSWYQDDQTASQVARGAAARQRAHIAATSNQSGGSPPFPIGHLTSLHETMLKRVAALEQATAALLREEQVGPLDARDLDEIKRELATLKTLPPAPARQPAEAIKTQGKLTAFAKKLAEDLAKDGAKGLIRLAAGKLWANYGDQLLDLARTIGEWLANLPPSF